MFVLFGMKNGYKHLDHHFKFIYWDLDANLSTLELGCQDLAWVTWICKWNMFVSNKLNEIWRVNMLLAWKWTLCEFCLNQWIRENPTSDQKELVGLISLINEFVGAFWVIVSRKTLKKCIRLIMEWLLSVLAKIRWLEEGNKD